MVLGGGCLPARRGSSSLPSLFLTHTLALSLTLHPSSSLSSLSLSLSLAPSLPPPILSLSLPPPPPSHSLFLALSLPPRPTLSGACAARVAWARMRRRSTCRVSFVHSSFIPSLLHAYATFNLKRCDAIKLSNLLLPRKSGTIKVDKLVPHTLLVYFRVQGYLTHKKTPTPLGPPKGPRLSPTVES